MKGKKIIFFIVCFVFFASTVLAGCSSSNNGSSSSSSSSNTNSSSGSNTNSATTTPVEKVKITFAQARSTLEENNQAYEDIVSAYNALNGKAEVKLLMIDFGETGNDHRTWVTTQLIGETAPDLFQSRYIWTHEDFGKELIADVNEYLSQPNPYNQNMEWESTFADAIIANMIVPTTDKIAGIPTFSLSVRLFYNQEIFDRLGITEIPETWDQFNEMQALIKSNDIVPMAIGFNNQGGDRPNWMTRYFSDQTVEHLVPELDLDGNGRITSNEIVYGIDEGIIDFSKAPFKDIFPILKDWTQYWPRGFNGLEANDATEMFLRGDAAMTLNLPAFAREIEGFFEYGVMRVPYLSKNQHQSAQERFYEVAAGNPDGVYAMPITISEQKKEAAADFLMYLTSPEVQQIIAEVLYRVPVLRDADFPDNMSQFLILNEPFKMNLFGPAFSRELYETFGRDGQLYLDGTITLDEFTSRMNTSAESEAKNLKESQGWSKENRYGTQN